MYIGRENEKLYLRPLDFNVCRIMTQLAEIVKNNGGKVKPIRNALVCDRNLDNSEFVQVTHTTNITFVCDEIAYYFQVDQNPFFPFYYTKTPVRNGKFSKDACLDEFTKKWLFDCLFKSEVPDAIIKQAAQIIFEELIKARFSIIRRDSHREKVANTFSPGWHWETVQAPERMEKVDF